MTAATLSRDPFMPQAPKVRGRAIALAVLAHGLLIVGLMFSVNWGSEEPATVAAELWSATPQAAAPRAVEPPPTTPPPEVQKVEPVVKPMPTPKPPEPVVAAKPPAPAPTPALPDPQIAIEKAKKETAKRLAAEQEEAKQQKREKAERERAERDKQELAQKKLEKQEKDKADKLKAEQAKAEQAKNEKSDKAEAAKREAARADYLKRMQQGLPGATGGANDTGTAIRSSGPSDAYGGRIAARIKPNIVFTDPVDGNPRAEVELRLAPDGSIAGKRLVKSSGVKSWDDAVLRAIERTETFPLDNGRVPPPIVIGFRPRD